MDGMNMSARPQQTRLVEIARAVLAEDEKQLIQAGTGTGKSFALLATALEASKETKLPSVVVCPTNNLIDQYVLKDAPRVQKILGGTFEYLKGRSHYLCTQSQAARKLMVKDADALYERFVAEGVLEWAKAGLEGWGCSGDCNQMFGDKCAMQEAKKRCAQADVIITNGHVLVWDLKVSQMTAGAANLLPAYGALFIDECHEIDNVAKNCNSDSIGPKSSVYDYIDGLYKWVQNRISTFDKGVREVKIEVDETLSALMETADEEAGRLESQIASLAGNPENVEEIKALRKELKIYERFIDFATSGDDRFISTISVEEDKDGTTVAMLNRRCVNSASWMRQILTRQASILVSGTIPSTLAKRLGIGGTPMEDVGTPFDYSKSVLAISPFDARNKNDDHKRIMEVCGAVLDMCKRPHSEGGGGTLILFTSWADMERVMPQVHRFLAANMADVPPVFMQTRGNPQETAEDLKAFKAHGHAVMGGVQSMWTGVDVPGDALRQVVIFRLPWPVPTPEIEAVKAIHGYQTYSDAMMALFVQGSGRLVRQVSDNGRLFVADCRAKGLRFGSNPMSKHLTKFQPLGH